MSKLDEAIAALERLAATERAWNGPRNLPKLDARKRRRRAVRDARRRNRG